MGAKVALVASLGLLGLARLGFAPNPGSAGFWTGALGSLAGVGALTMLCPALEVSHLLMGHATVIVAVSGLVGFAGRRFLKR